MSVRTQNKIDVSHYQEWEKIVTPEGRTLYIVPGSGLAYDPFLSQQMGHNIFYKNPKADIKAQQEAQRKGSAEGQLQTTGLAVGGTVAGTLAGQWAMNKFGPANAGNVQIDGKGNVYTPYSDGSYSINGGPRVYPGSNQASLASATATTPAAAPNSEAFMSGTNASAAPAGGPQEAYYPVGTAANGGTIMSNGDVVNADGSVVRAGGGTTGVNYGAVAQGAVGAYQGYQGYKDWQSGDKVGGGLEMGAGAANIGSSLGSSYASSAVPYMNAALGAYRGYKTLSDDNMTGKQKATRIQQQAGLAVADYYTFGGASALEGLLRSNKTTRKYMQKLDALDASTNPTSLILQRFMSSKGADQMFRDKVRKYWIEKGLIDSNYQGTLADGSKFDFGKDGKGLTKLDYKDSLTTRVIPLVDILSTAEGFTDKARSPISVLYTGAALSNAGGDYEKARANVQHFAQQRGLNQDNVLARLKQLHDEKRISDSEFAAYSNQTNELFRAGPAPTPVKQDAPVAAPVDTSQAQNAQQIGEQLAHRYNARNKI